MQTTYLRKNNLSIPFLLFSRQSANSKQHKAINQQ